MNETEGQSQPKKPGKVDGGRGEYEADLYPLRPCLALRRGCHHEKDLGEIVYDRSASAAMSASSWSHSYRSGQLQECSSRMMSLPCGHPGGEGVHKAGGGTDPEVVVHAPLAEKSNQKRGRGLGDDVLPYYPLRRMHVRRAVRVTNGRCSVPLVSVPCPWVWIRWHRYRDSAIRTPHLSISAAITA